MTAPTTPSRPVVVATLGAAQILAWGLSYYLVAVLAKPVVTETGWPMEWVVGALSLALLVSGLVSPPVGRMIERRGGRGVLMASAVLLALGLVAVGAAPALPVFLAGWLVIGLAMGAGLYDPVFAALGRLYGEHAGPAIAQVSLWGGFASTLCWPLGALAVERLGWRGACFAFAAVALAAMLPLYAFGFPRELARPPAPAAPPGAIRGRRGALLSFAAIMTLASVITTVVSVHLLTLLQARGLTLAEAVALGALFGPAQVAARLIETAFGRHHHPVWTLVISTVGVTAGLAMLAGDRLLIAAGVLVYGAGSGVRAIARGTVPLALFGRDGYAALMGRLAVPVLVAQAASPSIGAVLMENFGAGGTMAALCAAAAANIGLTLVLLAVRPR